MPEPALDIVIVDDHRMVIDGLMALLAQHEDLVVAGFASRADEALQCIAQTRPDVLLLDIDMPGMNGIVLLEKLTQQFPEVAVIMLSMHLEPAVILRCMALGARSYLPKNAAGEDVVAAIRTVGQGGHFLSSEVQALLDERRQTVPDPIPGNDAEGLAKLSEREREVLAAIAEGASSKEIADNLFLSPRTIDTHRTNIMRKLGINKVAGLIRFAMRNGMVQ
jgi:DNA-binding NarL/FixJ family response regulator